MRRFINNIMNKIVITISVVVLSLLTLPGIVAADSLQLRQSLNSSPFSMVTVKQVELSGNTTLQARVRMALHLDMRAVKVGFGQHQSVQVSQIRLHADKLELVGHRLRSTVSRHSAQPLKVWFEEVTLTIPRQYLSGSWDVNSLQRELERLGVKIKPKPTAPKPTTQFSG